MKRIMNILLCTAFVFACSFAFSQNKPQSNPGGYSQPATLQKSTTRAYFNISKQDIDFGVIPLGEKKVIEVTFTNTGVKPLIITDAYVNCGCTSIDFPKEPFMPGKSGKLKISYDADEEGFFNKTITLFSNGENKKETIKIQGIVAKD